MFRRLAISLVILVWPTVALADTGLGVSNGNPAGTASDSSAGLLQPAGQSQLQPNSGSSNNLQQPASDPLQNASNQQSVSGFDGTINAAAGQPLPSSTGSSSWRWWLLLPGAILIGLALWLVLYKPPLVQT